MRAALAEGTGHVLVATALGGSLGRGRNGAPGLPAAGVAGLVKSVARERPGLRIRSVDLDPARDEDELAGQLALELACTDAVHEVGYAGGARLLTRAVPSERPSNGAPARIELTEDAVVLLTGGARGITARVAESLARRCPCRFVLVGRTPAPAGGPDPELAAAADAPSLRRALAARGDLTSPAEIDAACRRILAEREIAATLDALRQAGATVEYHTVDVRDEAAFGGLIDDVYERCGRLDGVIHAAGVIEDRLLEDKSPESFARVYDTKVAGALTLAAKLRDDVRFVCFFSSVAAAFGNRGQVDYAAANDFLDKLAVALNERMSGRVFSINWGPWKNGGMVSRELERELERHGIGLIAPAEGVESFLAELSLGAPDDAQVVLMKADPASLR
jgi:NAD(P)-dependent dehydrogenase (short-subunit alcohol dehydrogenase family)